jgi:hypothetical protein
MQRIDNYKAPETMGGLLRWGDAKLACTILHCMAHTSRESCHPSRTDMRCFRKCNESLVVVDLWLAGHTNPSRPIGSGTCRLPADAAVFNMFWSGHLPEPTSDGLQGPPDS